jgi:flagellar basal-body rod protein FlgB
VGGERSVMTEITELLQAGAHSEQLRQQAIAANVANLETPGYRRIDIRFAQLLEKALASDNSEDIGQLEPEFFNPMKTPVKPNGNDVSLENEVGQMVENSLRYKLYVKLLNKKYQQMESAIQTP